MLTDRKAFIIGPPLPGFNNTTLKVKSFKLSQTPMVKIKFHGDLTLSNSRVKKFSRYKLLGIPDYAAINFGNKSNSLFLLQLYCWPDLFLTLLRPLQKADTSKFWQIQHLGVWKWQILANFDRQTDFDELNFLTNFDKLDDIWQILTNLANSDNLSNLD